MTTKLMIDIESMSLRDNAAIISIGAVTFNSKGITDEFYRSISLNSSMAAGLVVDADTIKFWMAQSDRARTTAMEGTTGLLTALKDFVKWVTDLGELREVWTNGDRDLVWLDSAFRATYTPADNLFPFWTKRDFRTARAILPPQVITDEPVSHHALYDARWQARYLTQALKGTT